MPIISYNRLEKNITIEIYQYIALVHFYTTYLCLVVRFNYREGSAGKAVERLKKIVVADNVTIDLLQGNNPRADKILNEYGIIK